MLRKSIYVTLLGLGFACTGAQAQGRYTITDLSSISSDSVATWKSINNAGDLGGGSSRGVYSYINGELAAHPYNMLSARISNNGTLIFNTYNDENFYGAPLAYAVVNGVAKQLPLEPYGGANWVADINDRGVMVGAATNDVYTCSEWGGCVGESRAVVFGNDRPTVIGVLPGDNQSAATAINNQGAIAGWSGNRYGTKAFVYTDGAMHDLYMHVDGSAPVAINNAGQVAGTYDLGPNQKGSWLLHDGKVEYFDMGDRSMAVVDLNNAGQMLGNSGGIGFYDARPWIRTGGQITMLDELLKEQGWSVREVFDLNDKGQIVAQVKRPDGAYVFAVLTPDEAPVLLDEAPVLLPVPEPDTYAMLVAGLGGMALWRRRARSKAA